MKYRGWCALVSYASRKGACVLQDAAAPDGVEPSKGAARGLGAGDAAGESAGDGAWGSGTLTATGGPDGDAAASTSSATAGPGSWRTYRCSGCTVGLSRGLELCKTNCTVATVATSSRATSSLYARCCMLQEKARCAALAQVMWVCPRRKSGEAQRDALAQAYRGPACTRANATLLASCCPIFACTQAIKAIHCQSASAQARMAQEKQDGPGKQDNHVLVGALIYHWAAYTTGSI